MEVTDVQMIAPWYINWVKVNRPEMLKERKAKVPKKPKPFNDEYRPSAIKPNYDFDNEVSEHPGKVITPIPKLSWDEAF